MQEQRKRVRSNNPAERLAAALLIPGEMARRLVLLGNSEIAQLLDEEVCANLSLLAPEATICVETAHRLRGAIPKARCARRLWARRAEQGEHVLHTKAALYRAGIPFLQLPWQMNRFASSTFLVSDVAAASVLAASRFSRDDWLHNRVRTQTDQTSHTSVRGQNSTSFDRQEELIR